MRATARLLRRLADRLDPTARSRHAPIVVQIDSEAVIRQIVRRNKRKGKPGGYVV